MIKITKGLDIPLTGAPQQTISADPAVNQVALVGSDYVGMKPTLLVNEGDLVKKGQKLFEDKKIPGVFFTAPVAGKVEAIHRGDRRVFQSLVISKSGEESVSFSSYKNKKPADLSEGEVRALLQESGLWVSLRKRPFSKTPAIDSKPQALFITAIDTRPHCPQVPVVMQGQEEDFQRGIEVLSQIAPRVFVITDPDTKIALPSIAHVEHHCFSGPHPAGNVGTHIHYLFPVGPRRSVWHLDYQDCIAIGHLFRTGQLQSERVISIAGPQAQNPRLMKTLLGASLKDLTQNEIAPSDKPIRVVSGSVLGGRTAAGPEAFLGRFHSQVSLLEEDHSREFLGWNSPGVNKYSLKHVFLSAFSPGKKFPLTTNKHGSLRALVPIGAYEAVMPGDFLPTYLLRYLLARNTDKAVELGALELDEEDLALCTFVDPCKNEFGPVLRENLNLIEKEG